MRTPPLWTETLHRVEFFGFHASGEQMPQRAASFKGVDSEEEHAKWMQQLRVRLAGDVVRASEWRAQL